MLPPPVCHKILAVDLCQGFMVYLGAGTLWPYAKTVPRERMQGNGTPKSVVWCRQAVGGLCGGCSGRLLATSAIVI